MVEVLQISGVLLAACTLMFLVCLVLKIFLELCSDNNEKWWGGVPLWMGGFFFIIGMPIIILTGIFSG